MIEIHLKQAFRRLRKQKTFSFVIIFGLAISLAVSYLILSFVHFEKSFDGFHESADNLYRINVVGDGVGKDAYKSPYSYAPQGPVAVAELPEIEKYVRLIAFPTISISGNSNSDISNVVSESDYYYADETFFDLFSFPLILGDKNEVLLKPYSVVISQSLAERLFADKNPIGEVLQIDGKYTSTVTGVFKDTPQNTHLKFNLLFSISSIPWIMNEHHAWSNHSLFTYVLLNKDVNPRETEKKLYSLFGREDRARSQMDDCTWELQNVSQAYINTQDFTSKPDCFKFGNSRMVYFLTIIALLIILIAWINYINISTSIAEERAKEIGVRRSNGAGKVQVGTLFFSESFIYNIIGMLIAALIIFVFSKWSANTLSFSFESLQSTNFHKIIAVLLAAGLIIPGAVTSLVMAYKPLNKKGKGTSHFSFRNALVIFQFVIVIGLMSGVFIINKQLNYIYSIDLGFQKDQVLVLNAPRVDFNFRDERKLDLFKEKLTGMSAIEGVTASVSVPGRRFGSGNGGPDFSGKPNEETYFRIGRVMPGFFDFYGIDLLAGRVFSDKAESNKHSIIISEEAVAEFGYQNPEEILGRRVQWIDGEYDVIGITKSFHQESLHIEPEPVIFFTHVLDADYNYISIKLNTTNIKENIASIKSEYHSIFPENPFDFFFLDSYFDRQYQKDILFKKLFNVFSVIALLIGYFGLFGLTTYRIIKRTKEIGVRKVNGARVSEIIKMLSTDFTKWIVISIIIGCPLSWFAMQKWLENFAYRTEISWWIFVLSGVISLAITLATVSWISWRTANRNPVEALKYE